MGGFIRDSTTLDILAQLNNRFGAGSAISELIALHGEFDIFTGKHALRSSYELIGVRPLDQKERKGWHVFLEKLKTYPSDRDGVNGHDRIVAAYQENFQDPKPLPIFTQCHPAADDPRVVITKGYPIVFSKEEHLIKSIPIIPATNAPGP